MPPTTDEAASLATTSETDFYELLQLSPDVISAAAIRKAFRQQSLKWHPDKNPSPEAASKFHLLTTAYDVISDPQTRAAYDSARAARLAKKRRSEQFDAARRRMQEELEHREKRARTDAGDMGWGAGATGDEGDEEARFQAQLRRLQEEGARLRRKREEALRAAAKEEEEAATAAATAAPETKKAESRFSELDRTVRVRWRRKGKGETMDEEALRKLFARFGKVQDVVMPRKSKDKDKEKEDEKRYLTGLIVFESVVAAHAAVRDALKGGHTDADGKDEFRLFKTVTWASGKEPDLSGVGTPPPSSTQSTPATAANPTPTTTPASAATGGTGTPAKKAAWVPPASVSTPKNGLKKVPSFASFSAAAKTPQSQTGSPFSKSAAANSPDYESITLMRMRDAEKRRLEAELRRQEAEAEDDGKEAAGL